MDSGFYKGWVRRRRRAPIGRRAPAMRQTGALAGRGGAPLRARSAARARAQPYLPPLRCLRRSAHSNDTDKDASQLPLKQPLATALYQNIRKPIHCTTFKAYDALMLHFVCRNGVAPLCKRQAIRAPGTFNQATARPPANSLGECPTIGPPPDLECHRMGLPST